ncbi:hypothetical protein C7964_10739 [Loktanella sp. PT4BL]|uniref:hypothetical protein n=1 Tax=Loktanella sp. PT4BL TaxID=2135611 RepID=UPI000D847ABB|nr:hypothetical protein [Loktanella sp. PT4BL]PXW67320.1 hypothetical protein C7964_10739 [Loktanella sp. PT4BL]
MIAAAEGILLAREVHFPATIANLWDPEKMLAKLRIAHDYNDEVLAEIYVNRRIALNGWNEVAQTNIEDGFKNVDYLNPEERDDWAEVQHYIYASTYAIGALEKLPLANRLLRQTHEILMTGLRGKHERPGHFRESQNWIGVSLKNVAFIPPHYGHVPDVMSDVEAFLHANDLCVSAALDCNRALSVRNNPPISGS